MPDGERKAVNMDFQQHPLSAAFPSMPEVELDALSEDIKKHGQREPGVTLGDMVLDGWHRYLACQRVGVEFVAYPFAGDDPVAFVLSRNLHRRHLSAAQRVAAVATCNGWAPAHRPDKGGSGSPLMTNEALAEAADASVKTVKRVKAGIRAGLGEALKDGKVSAEKAAEVAKLPKAKRAKAVAAIEAGEALTLPKPRAVIASREVEKLYESVKADLIDVQGKYADQLEKVAELADALRVAEDRVQALEASEPDEQQKLIMDLQQKIQRKDGEIARLTAERNRLNDKCNQLIRQVKSLQKGKQ